MTSQLNMSMSERLDPVTGVALFEVASSAQNEDTQILTTCMTTRSC
jgi:hypothetical protein